MSAFVRMMGRIFLGITVLWASPARAATVIVYVSEDQVFSQPILEDFERETGIEVKAVYDTEETKSTGVMNRLIAEKNNPQADVYWANEPIRPEVLKQRGIAVPYFSPNAKEISAAFNSTLSLRRWV
jgi:iron(III) transport system substrate-binding protein